MNRLRALGTPGEWTADALGGLGLIAFFVAVFIFVPLVAHPRHAHERTVIAEQK